MQRREFIAAAGMTAASMSAARSAGAERPQPLRILILGGTRFIGVHVTELALQRGHVVTLFNRGQTNTQLFPQLEKLKGDRDAKLGTLQGRKWDVVIDDSGFVPRHVRLSAQLLAPKVRQYRFVSSGSVYASFATGPDEDSPLGKLCDETVEKVDANTYGPLKALCEQAVAAALPGRGLVVRPGYIVGPNDNSDRFTYWPARATRGGDMLAPNAPRDPIQFVDVRDLAQLSLDLIERNVTGTLNVVSPPGQFTMGDLLGASVSFANSLAKPSLPPRPVWVPTEFMKQHNVSLGTDMPICSELAGAHAAFTKISAARATKASLKIRPINETVRDTLAWHLQRPESERAVLKAGIDPVREGQVLSAWHAVQANRQ
jgi:2'-hydroxyisoflavone reductase